jgi:hypothetical protein
VNSFSEELSEAETYMVRKFLMHKLQYSQDLADIVTVNPDDEDWYTTRLCFTKHSPKYSKNNPVRPTNTTAKCRLCGKTCSAYCALCFQFGGPCADMVPTCSTCGHEHYFECHAKGSSSVKKTLMAGARIPVSNPLHIHNRSLVAKATNNAKKNIAKSKSN